MVGLEQPRQVAGGDRGVPLAGQAQRYLTLERVASPVSPSLVRWWLT